MQQKQRVTGKKVIKKEYQKFVFELRKKGIFFSRFCEQNGVRRQDAEKAFNGTWKGEKATELKTRLINASKGKTDFLTTTE